MRTRQQFFVGTILVITMMVAGTAWGDTVDILAIGGNPIVDRQFVDTSSNFYLLDTNQPFSGEGRLRHWEIYAETTHPVQLVIYRQTEGVFSVVGQSAVETPVVGYNLFDLDPSIPVTRGDFIGIFHPSTGSVSFTLDPPGIFGFDDLTGTVLFTSQGGSPTAFTRSSYRRYSIRAFKKDD
jgi:hypothetical protein